MKKLVNAKVVRETEKAALIECEIGPGGHRQVWFPKSQIQITDEYIAAKDWIVSKKAEELGVNHLMVAFQAV